MKSYFADEGELQQMAEREAHWRSRSIDLVGLAIDHDLGVSLCENPEAEKAVREHVRSILADLKAERPQPTYGHIRQAVAMEVEVQLTQSPAIEEPSVDVVAPAIEERPIDQPLPEQPTQSAQEPVAPIKKADTGKRTIVQPTKAEAERRRAKDGYKVCKTCDERLPVERFTKHPQTSDGFDPNCKKCRVGAAKARRDAKRGRQMAMSQQRPQSARKPAESVHVAPEPQLNRNGKPNPFLEARKRAATEAFLAHVNAGGLVTNEYMGEIMADYGLNLIEVKAIREEALGQRKPGAEAKADRASKKYDNTPPPYQPSA